MIDRRRFLLGSSLLGLGACSNISLLEDFADVASVTSRSDAYPMSPEQIAASPYALLGVRVAEVGRAVLVLAKAEGGDLHWVSADRAALITRHGRIIKTIGFKLNLREILMPSSVRAVFAEPRTASMPSDAQLQLELNGDQTLSLTAKVRYQRAQRHTAGGSEVELKESLRIDSLKWSADNRYRYEGATGRFVASRQALHPNIPLLELEVLKNYQA